MTALHWQLCSAKGFLTVSAVTPHERQDDGQADRRGSSPFPAVQSLRVTASETSFVPLHLHVAFMPLEGTVCFEMKFLSFPSLCLRDLLFLLYSSSTLFSLKRVVPPFVPVYLW